MITLPSRHYPSPEDFEQDFYDSITPGIIPRRNFVEWHTIEKKTRGLISCVEFYSSLRERLSGGLTREEEFIQELADSLLACDNPMGYLECAFEMLGHTDRELVTCEDDVSLVNLAQAIQAGDESTAIEFAQLLFDLGFLRILRRNDLDDVLFGVQVGLESHRRKNIGGSYFKGQVRSLLQHTVEVLGSLVDQPVELLEEVKIPCSPISIISDRPRPICRMT